MSFQLARAILLTALLAPALTRAQPAPTTPPTLVPAPGTPPDGADADRAGGSSIESPTDPTDPTDVIESPTDPTDVEGGEEVEEVEDEPVEWEPEQALVDYVAASSKVTEPARQSPSSVWVVTREQIELAGYRSVAEALTQVPGLTVSYDLDNYNVALRGLYGGARAGSRYIKVMIDGRAISFAQSGVHYLGPEFIPIVAVERIEIVRGPVSSLYGAGALAGAINVVTRRPSYEGALTSNTVIDGSGLLLGTRGGMGQGVQTFVGRRSFLLLAAGGGYLDRSGLGLAREASGFWKRAQFKDELSKNDTARPMSALIHGEHYVGGGRFSAIGTLQMHDAVNEFHDLVTLGYAAGTTAGAERTTGARSQLYTAGVGLNFERPTSSGLTVLASAGYWTGGTRGSEVYDIEPMAEYVLRRELSYQLIEGGLELRYDLGGNSWIQAGVDGQVDSEKMPDIIEVNDAASTTRIRQVGTTETLSNIGVYGQVLMPLHDKVRIAGNVRWDQSNVFGGAFSARAAVVATPTPRLAIKVMGGRSYKAPSPEQLFGIGLGGLDVSGKADLPQQFVNGAEVLFDYYLLRQLNLNVGGYYQKYSDTLAYVQREGKLQARAFDADSVGLEANLRMSFTAGPLRIDGSSGLTLQSLTTEQEIQPGGIVEKDIPDNEGVAKLMFNGRLAVFGPKGAGGQILVRRSGERTPSQSNLLLVSGNPDMSDPMYMLRPYTVVDASVSSPAIPLDGKARSAATLRLRGGVSNLLDRRYGEVGFNGVDIPTLGRTLWFTGTLAF